MVNLHLYGNQGIHVKINIRNNPAIQLNRLILTNTQIMSKEIVKSPNGFYSDPSRPAQYRVCFLVRRELDACRNFSYPGQLLTPL